MELAQMQSLIQEIRAARGFTTDPLRVMTLLTEEVGEVAGELKKTWSPNYPEMQVEDFANELADAFVLLSALASKFDIDLEHAVMRKFVETDSNREWPSARPT